MGLTEEAHTVFPEDQALAPFKIRMLDWRGHGFCPARADRFVAMALDGNPVAIDVMVQWVEEYIYRGEKMPENLWYFAQQRLRGKVSVKKGRYRLKSQRNLEIAKVVYDLHKVWSHTLGTPVHMRANDEKSPGSDTSPFYACEIVSEALSECGITLGRDGVYKAWKTHEARVELWWRYLTNEWDEIGLVLGGHPLWDHRNPREWQ